MGLMYDLNLNRECMECAHGEFDLLEQKYWCCLRGIYRGPQDTEACPDQESQILAE